MPSVDELQYRIGELEARLHASEAEADYLRGMLREAVGANQPAAFEVVRAGVAGPPATSCSFCKDTFTELTPGIQTLHVRRGGVTLCEVCYANAGNDVR